ncbi:MAG: hypothetical protein RMK18_00325 [Armatimonadota bacterium]|nr:hypothetical protein [Armatimonadota bacterium]MCX7776505.1 hypothetical protein [Armatimonadota bacterium]MDW8024302.1 hypothetical protein [Armatimonadota bacterium]
MRRVGRLVTSLLGFGLLVSVIVIGFLARYWGQQEELQVSAIVQSRNDAVQRRGLERLLSQVGELKLRGDRLFGKELSSGRNFELGFSELLYSGEVLKLRKAICNVSDESGIVASFESSSVIVVMRSRLLEFVGNVVLRSHKHSAVIRSDKVRWCWESGKVAAFGNVSLTFGDRLVGSAGAAYADTVLGEVELSGKPSLCMRLSKWLKH